MPSLHDYFVLNRYKAKYYFGERIFGYWNKIPFVGTVGNDTVISDLVGPQLSIHLDLPIKYKNITYIILVAPHTEFKKITKLIEMKEENDKITNRKTRS